MSKKTYNLHLKGYVGGWDFDSDYVDFVLNKNADNEVHVLIDSLGGSLATALSIVASFRNHGNVHVHYVGMNASAATIASLGAKHVSIDSSAMYLVHKCSMEFFQWASANADKLRSIIKEAELMKENLDKMDSNIAEMYAKKCKKEPTDLLALMKKGGWLTAKEALEWGFVDEITDYEDDAAPVITDLVAADMSAAGIPIPSDLPKEQPSVNVLTRFIDALTNIFNFSANREKSQTRLLSSEVQPDSQSLIKSNQNPKEEMNPETNQPQAQQQVETPSAEPQQQQSETVTAEAHATAIAAKDAEIARLNAEIAALKKAPGDTTSHIVDDKKNGGEQNHDEDPASAEAFYNTRQRAQALYDILPH